MNITFDSNVLLSALLWDQSISQKLLVELIRRGDVEIFVSNQILEEFSRILERDFGYDYKRLIDAVNMTFKVIDAPVIKGIVEADPDDDKVIACAVASNSQYIISYDEHLTSMSPFQDIQIITPETARAML